MKTEKMLLLMELDPTSWEVKLSQLMRPILAMLLARRTSAVGVAQDEVEAGVEISPRLENPTVVLATATHVKVAKVEVVVGFQLLAAEALTRTPTKRIIRAPMLWRIQCRRVVSGMRKARSAKGKIVGPGSVKVVGSIALPRTGVMTDLIAPMSSTRIL
jgi:hypothetical protein